MNPSLKCLWVILGTMCLILALWLVTNPLGEFNGLAVGFLTVAGVVGLYGGMRG